MTFQILSVYRNQSIQKYILEMLECPWKRFNNRSRNTKNKIIASTRRELRRNLFTTNKKEGSCESFLTCCLLYVFFLSFTILVLVVHPLLEPIIRSSLKKSSKLFIFFISPHLVMSSISLLRASHRVL